MKGVDAGIELLAALAQASVQALSVRSSQGSVSAKGLGQRFRRLPTRRDTAVEVKDEVAQADVVEAPQDRVDRGPLLSDEEHPLAAGDEGRDQVADRLA